MTDKKTLNPLSKESGLSVKFMQENGYVHWREIDGIVYAIAPMSFGKGRLLVDVSLMSYEDFYCFPSIQRAIDSLDRYQGEDGPEFTDWHRHYSTSRRREDGDPTKETIRQ